MLRGLWNRYDTDKKGVLTALQLGLMLEDCGIPVGEDWDVQEFLVKYSGGRKSLHFQASPHYRFLLQGRLEGPCSHCTHAWHWGLFTLVLCFCPRNLCTLFAPPSAHPPCLQDFMTNLLGIPHDFFHMKLVGPGASLTGNNWLMGSWLPPALLSSFTFLCMPSATPMVAFVTSFSGLWASSHRHPVVSNSLVFFCLLEAACIVCK